MISKTSLLSFLPLSLSPSLPPSLPPSRTATKSEISKAYRKLAQKWHPDAYDGDDKKAAEKKFYDIAAAKEVLTDPGSLSLPPFTQSVQYIPSSLPPFLRAAAEV